MTPSQLQVLVAIVETGSFTAAATALDMTQSGVSHALATLETELGATLLERDRRGVSLTDAGSRVLVEARAVLQHLEQLRREAASGQVRGRLRLGILPSVATRLLPPVIGAFAQRYPAVELILQEGTDDEVREWLRTRLVDISVVTLPQSGLTTLPLARDAMLAIVPSGHELASAPAIAPAQLAANPFIMCAGGCEPLIRTILQAAGVAPQVRFQVRDIGTILALVREGLGVTMAPALTLPDALDGVRALNLSPPTQRHLALAIRDIDRTTPVISAFIELVREMVDSSICYGIEERAGRLLAVR